jgi:transcriptional regulator with XRE-family HTH domain
MNYFASNIKFLRKRKGLQQAEICSLTVFKQSTWSGYESNFSKPNFKDLLKIIEFFEVSASELLEMDLSNVNLNENGTQEKESGNVNRNITLNDKKGKNQPCQECIVKDNFIAVKDQLLQNENELIDSLHVQIKLLKNQIEQMKYETHKKQQTQRKDRKSA